MTARVDAALAELDSLVQGIRARMVRLRELEMVLPVEVDEVKRALLADLRSWSPATLSTLAEPVTPLRDDAA